MIHIYALGIGIFTTNDKYQIVCWYYHSKQHLNKKTDIKPMNIIRFYQY